MVWSRHVSVLRSSGSASAAGRSAPDLRPAHSVQPATVSRRYRTAFSLQRGFRIARRDTVEMELITKRPRHTPPPLMLLRRGRRQCYIGTRRRDCPCS